MIGKGDIEAQYVLSWWRDVPSTKKIRSLLASTETKTETAAVLAAVK